MITEYCGIVISTTVPKRSSGCRHLWPHWLRLGWQRHGYPQAFSTTRRVPEENCRQYERPVRCEVSAIAEAAVRTPSGWV
jgi:hypothetical protein